jgi:hypothetical protein
MPKKKPLKVFTQPPGLTDDQQLTTFKLYGELRAFAEKQVEDTLQQLVKTQGSEEKAGATRLFETLANVLDLLLEPEAAEDAIGNLAELYARRVAVGPGHAKRWLVAQVIWIIYGRAMDLFGRFMRARAGK